MGSGPDGGDPAQAEARKRENFKRVGICMMPVGAAMVGVALLLPRILGAGDSTFMIQTIMGGVGLVDLVTGAVFLKIGTESDSR